MMMMMMMMMMIMMMMMLLIPLRPKAKVSGGCGGAAPPRASFSL